MGAITPSIIPFLRDEIRVLTAQWGAGALPRTALLVWRCHLKGVVYHLTDCMKWPGRPVELPLRFKANKIQKGQLRFYSAPKKVSGDSLALLPNPNVQQGIAREPISGRKPGELFARETRPYASWIAALLGRV